MQIAEVFKDGHIGHIYTEEELKTYDIPFLLSFKTGEMSYTECPAEVEQDWTFNGKTFEPPVIDPRVAVEQELNSVTAQLSSVERRLERPTQSVLAASLVGAAVDEVDAAKLTEGEAEKAALRVKLAEIKKQLAEMDNA